jgi:hypothetical protein
MRNFTAHLASCAPYELTHEDLLFYKIDPSSLTKKAVAAVPAPAVGSNPFTIAKGAAAGRPRFDVADAAAPAVAFGGLSPRVMVSPAMVLSWRSIAAQSNARVINTSRWTVMRRAQALLTSSAKATHAQVQRDVVGVDGKVCLTADGGTKAGRCCRACRRRRTCSASRTSTWRTSSPRRTRMSR